MFDYDIFNKKKAERAKYIVLNKISNAVKELPISGDRLDLELNIQHLKSIINGNY